uniref:Uncharacterized protein n=1 Tax=Castor canadensis TaxID=51338 RepID=A0A8C0ZPN5_CASCN
MAWTPPGPTPSGAQLPSGGLGSFRPRSTSLPAGQRFPVRTRLFPVLFGFLRRPSALSVAPVWGLFLKYKCCGSLPRPPLFKSKANDLFSWVGAPCHALWAEPLETQLCGWWLGT